MHGKIDTVELTACLPCLHRFAFSLTRNPDQAADLVQDTVERALKKAALFDGANLRAWLMTICRRIFLNDVLRNKSRGNTVEIEDAPSESVSVSAQQETQVHFKDVSRAFELLTASDKHVISLIALKGMAYSEVAEIMNRPVGTIRSRLSRARAKLVASVEMGAKAPRPTMLQAA